MKLTPMRAIRKKCLDCSCDQAGEVRNCQIERCPLWPYRFGRNPENLEIVQDDKRFEGTLRGARRSNE